MTNLPKNFLRQLNSAQGWLQLGDWEEARAELEQVASEHSTNPILLILRVEVCRAAKDWGTMAEISRELTQMQPTEAGHWLNLAYALRRSAGLDSARAVLEKAASMFYNEFLIWFNLACYCAQLGLLHEARAHLNLATELNPECRKFAKTDPDLEPLRKKSQK